MDERIIGVNIQKYRKLKGLTQEALAEMIGVTPHYVGLLETGRRRPSVMRLVAIANSLSVSADLILLELLDCRYQIEASEITKRLSVMSKEAADRAYKIVSSGIDNAF